MPGPDFPVAWWAFWLVTGLVIFCGLVWVFHRLAVWSDETTWREFLGRHGENNDPKGRGQRETQ